MADTHIDDTTPLDLPMQPTGSGVADLEILREQAALTGGEDVAELSPTDTGPATDESEAQPS